MARSRELLAASALVAIAGVVCFVWLLAMGKGTGFQGDELFYFANLVLDHGAAIPVEGLEYFFAPHNGHLVIGGRLIYRLLFALFGTDYVPFRAVTALCYVACVVLFYVLAIRRVRPLLAVVFSISLLFLGFGYEVMLWPFDIHTTLSLSLALGAILALERGDRTGDVLSCALLVLSITLIEIGLCFAVGAAVLIFQRGDRWKRVWVFAIPIVIYVVWSIWARKFGASEGSLAHANLIPQDGFHSLAAVVGSILGLNPTGSGVAPGLTGISRPAEALALVAVLAVGWRLYRRAVPPTLWTWLAIGACYWMTVALGDRPPDSVRYIFVGAVVSLLALCDCLKGVRIPNWSLAIAAVALAFTIPPNVAKITEGRNAWLGLARASGTEFAMLDAATGIVPAGYAPAVDPKVIDKGGSLYVPLSAENYVRGRERFGSLGYSQAHIRELGPQYLEVADASLVGALGLKLEPLGRRPAGECLGFYEATPKRPLFFTLKPGGAVLGSRAKGVVDVKLQHFAHGPGIEVGRLDPGEFAALATPSAEISPGPWRAVVNGPIEICPAG